MEIGLTPRPGAEWISEGVEPPEDPYGDPPEVGASSAAGPPAVHRSVSFTRASSIKVRPVHWLWAERVALGTLALLAGREGIGKSSLAYTFAAQVTRGVLPGVYYGKPRQVVVAATEDSWEHTIVPRLMAAGANLDMVLRVDVTTADGVETGLSLPRDNVGLEHLIREENVALVLLDPLMSRLATGLDTHKDAEVRLALEPLTKIADRTGSAFIGLIHVNKGGDTDPLNAVMGSRAFSAVARSVLFAMRDGDDEELMHLGTPKNNLGQTNLPTLDYRIEGVKVADTPEGEVWTSRIVWCGETSQSIRELLANNVESADARTAVGEATQWLEEFLQFAGGPVRLREIKAAAKQQHISLSTLHKARIRLKLVVESVPDLYPRENQWALPPAPIAKAA